MKPRVELGTPTPSLNRRAVKLYLKIEGECNLILGAQSGFHKSCRQRAKCGKRVRQAVERSKGASAESQDPSESGLPWGAGAL